MNDLGLPTRKSLYLIRSVPTGGISIEKLAEVGIEESFGREVTSSHSVLTLHERTIASYVIRTWVCDATGLPVSVSEGPK